MAVAADRRDSKKICTPGQFCFLCQNRRASSTQNTDSKRTSDNDDNAESKMGYKEDDASCSF